MRINIFITFIAIILIIPISSLACEMMLPASIEETISSADLIIGGEKIAQGPIGSDEYPFPGEAEWVQIQIKHLIKGNETEPVIKVKTNSPCSYGFPIPEEATDYLMYFSKDTETGSYGRVSTPSSRQSQALAEINEYNITYTSVSNNSDYYQVTEYLNKVLVTNNLSAIDFSGPIISQTKSAPRLNQFPRLPRLIGGTALTFLLITGILIGLLRHKLKE